MYCYRCGTENADDSDHCIQCDADLHMHANADAIKQDEDIRRLRRFIPDVIADSILNDADLLRSQRRDVAVMFVDAVGSTHLSTSLDAETTFLLINDLLSRLVDAVHSYGGLVDKFTGDGLMAVFGAPRAHENDAELAIRAALDMQVAAREFAQATKAQLGSAVQIRIGIHLGPVIAGLLGSEEQVAYTVIGETVNMASRIESLAQPGHILVSESVQNVTSGSFEFDNGQDVVVKGVNYPITVFEVIRDLNTQVTRGVQGTSPVYIGRDDELHTLHELLTNFQNSRQGQILLIIGEAGMGKSRLVQEWLSPLEHNFQIWRGRALPYAQGRGYGIFRSILTSAIANSDYMRQWTDHITAAFHPFIRQLLGIEALESDQVILNNMPPARMNQLMVLALREWISTAAQIQPLILMFDDYHWADDVSRQAMQSLLAMTTSLPILFCIMSRLSPEIGLDFSELADDKHSVMRLENLSLTDSRAILGHLIAINEFPESFKANILNHSGGNPFYIEEIVRMLIEKEIVQLREGLWHNSETYSLEDVEIPVSLQALMLTRVDRLPTDLRNLLQDAAVIGPEFSAEILAETEYRLRRYENIEPLVERLMDMGLLRRQHDIEATTYAFRHIFTQEAIYGSILRNRRPQLHRTVAEAVENLYPDHLDEYAEMLAYHYDQARIRAKALDYMLISGDHAKQRFANREAIEYYSRVIQLSQHLSQTEQARWHAAISLGDIQQHIGEYEEALAIYEAVVEEHRSAPAAQKAELMLRMGRVWDKRGNQQEAERWFNAALGQLETLSEKHSDLEADIYAAIGWLNLRSGNTSEAETALSYALSLVENTDALEVQATILNRLGGTYYTQGRQVLAAKSVQKSLVIREKLNDLFGVARSSNNLGILMQENGDLLSALEYFKRSLEAMKQIGDTEGQVIAHNNLGNAYIDTGEWALADEHLANSLQIARQIANPHRQAEAQLILGRLYYHSKRYMEAEQHLNAAIEQFEMAGTTTHPLLISTYTLLGMVALSQSENDKAQTWAEHAKEQLAQITTKLTSSTVEQGLYEQFMGLKALSKENFNDAVIHFRKSKTIYEACHSSIELGRSSYWCGIVLEKLGDKQSANIEWQIAQEIFTNGHATAELKRVNAKLKE